MKRYKLYDKSGVEDSETCNCVKCVNYKRYFHANLLLFTPSKEKAIERYTNNTILCEITYEGWKELERIEIIP